MKSPLRALLQATAMVAVLGTAGAGVATQSFAADTVMVGGAPMYPSKNIIENAVNSKDHTTLVAAVKAAGLVETLEGKGPFTVFAPTNEAFAKLPKGTVDTPAQAREQEEARRDPDLSRRCPASIRPRASWPTSRRWVDKAAYKTVEGDPLTFSMKDGAPVGLGRERRHRQGDDRRRQPVERRHPRHRHGAPAQDVSRTHHSCLQVRRRRLRPSGRGRCRLGHRKGRSCIPRRSSIRWEPAYRRRRPDRWGRRSASRPSARG